MKRKREDNEEDEKSLPSHKRICGNPDRDYPVNTHLTILNNPFQLLDIDIQTVGINTPINKFSDKKIQTNELIFDNKNIGTDNGMNEKYYENTGIQACFDKNDIGVGTRTSENYLSLNYRVKTPDLSIFPSTPIDKITVNNIEVDINTFKINCKKSIDFHVIQVNNVSNLDDYKDGFCVFFPEFGEKMKSRQFYKVVTRNIGGTATKFVNKYPINLHFLNDYGNGETICHKCYNCLKKKFDVIFRIENDEKKKEIGEISEMFDEISEFKENEKRESTSKIDFLDDDEVMTDLLSTNDLKKFGTMNEFDVTLYSKLQNEKSGKLKQQQKQYEENLYDNGLFEFEKIEKLCRILQTGMYEFKNISVDQKSKIIKIILNHKSKNIRGIIFNSSSKNNKISLYQKVWASFHIWSCFNVMECFSYCNTPFSCNKKQNVKNLSKIAKKKREKDQEDRLDEVLTLNKNLDIQEDFQFRQSQRKGKRSPLGHGDIIGGVQFFHLFSKVTHVRELKDSEGSWNIWISKPPPKDYSIIKLPKVMDALHDKYKNLSIIEIRDEFEKLDFKDICDGLAKVVKEKKIRTLKILTENIQLPFEFNEISKIIFNEHKENLNKKQLQLILAKQNDKIGGNKGDLICRIEASFKKKSIDKTIESVKVNSKIGYFSKDIEKVTTLSIFYECAKKVKEKNGKIRDCCIDGSHSSEASVRTRLVPIFGNTISLDQTHFRWNHFTDFDKLKNSNREDFIIVKEKDKNDEIQIRSVLCPHCNTIYKMNENGKFPKQCLNDKCSFLENNGKNYVFHSRFKFKNMRKLELNDILKHINKWTREFNREFPDKLHDVDERKKYLKSKLLIFIEYVEKEKFQLEDEEKRVLLFYMMFFSQYICKFLWTNQTSYAEGFNSIHSEVFSPKGNEFEVEHYSQRHDLTVLYFNHQREYKFYKLKGSFKHYWIFEIIKEFEQV